MLTRILTALIGVVVFFAAILSPIWVFPLIVFVVTVIMLSEMYSVLKCGKYVNTVGFLSAAAAFAVMAIKSNFLELYLAATILLYLISVIIKHGKTSSKDILSHGFITLYISVSMSFVARTALDYSIANVLWIFIIAWLTDTGAYFAGVFLGKHKLCPHISPKKTVEGAIGGVLTSVLTVIAYYFISINFIDTTAQFNSTALVLLAAMGLVGSVLSQLGDFVASCIKRDSDVKDYGSILPGHGGLMDRFDSVVFIAPFVYYSLALIQHTLLF